MKTRYLHHGSFNSQKQADDFIVKLQKGLPNRVFEVKKRTWTGKRKFRYLVRSLPKEGKQ
jgi:hypothetical protein